jgi:IclR family transcriptional regulator, KDG regulon repressor
LRLEVIKLAAAANVRSSAMARTVNALARALDILEAVADQEGPVTTGQLAARVEVPRSSLHELLHTLRTRGYLTLDASGYALGVRAMLLGDAYRSASGLPALARREIERLVEASDETSQVAVRDGAEVLYIDKRDGTQQLRLVSRVGQRLPASCTGVGKALLAALPEDELEALYPDGQLPTMTPNSITAWPAFIAELEDIKRRGVAFDHCESNPAVCCVAAPIRDASGTTLAALSVSVPSVRWSQEVADRLAGLVDAAATRVSAGLGASVER